MTPRPWDRSRLGLGLPGLVFLLWGWFAFPLSSGDLIWRGASRYVCLGDGPRLVFFYYVNRDGKALKEKSGFTARGGSAESESFPDGIVLFPTAIKLEPANVPGTSGFNLFVAYWLLILLYLPVWLGSLAWWQRRKSRLLKLHAAP